MVKKMENIKMNIGIYEMIIKYIYISQTQILKNTSQKNYYILYRVEFEKTSIENYLHLWNRNFIKNKLISFCLHSKSK